MSTLRVRYFAHLRALVVQEGAAIVAAARPVRGWVQAELSALKGRAVRSPSDARNSTAKERG